MDRVPRRLHLPWILRRRSKAPQAMQGLEPSFWLPDGSQWLRVRVLKPRLHGAQTASAHVSSYTSYLRISFPSSHPYRCARAGRRWGREAGSLTRKGPSSSRPVPGVSCQRSGFRTQWKRWIKGSASKSWPNSSRSMINASGSSFHKSRTPVCKIELREECMPLRAASHFNFPKHCCIAAYCSFTVARFPRWSLRLLSPSRCVATFRESQIVKVRVPLAVR